MKNETIFTGVGILLAAGFLFWMLSRSKKQRRQLEARTRARRRQGQPSAEGFPSQPLTSARASRMLSSMLHW